MNLPFADPLSPQETSPQTSPTHFLPGKFHLRANTFLGAKKQTPGILGAHASAITAYALSLTEAPEDLRSVAHNSLMALAQDIGEGVLAVNLRLGRA